MSDNKGIQSAIAAETAAIQAYQRTRSGRNVLGIDRSMYAGYKTPGMDVTRMFSDPPCILKDADARRASGDQYLWRKPDDTYTKALCLRGILTAITSDEVDPASPFANIDRAKIITKTGAREVVRSPAGLGLFKAPPGIDLSAVDAGLLPGRQWEAKYLDDVTENEEQFQSDMEMVSRTSLTGRVSGEITTKETQREPIL
jgi:hypothetical protein